MPNRALIFSQVLAEAVIMPPTAHNLNNRHDEIGGKENPGAACWGYSAIIDPAPNHAKKVLAKCDTNFKF